MKDTSFVEARQARKEAGEKLREERETIVREARGERDRRKREKRHLEERLARDFSLTRDSESEDDITVTEKRSHPSPKDVGPDKKASRHHRSTSRTSSEGGGSRVSSPGHQ